MILVNIKLVGIKKDTMTDLEVWYNILLSRISVNFAGMLFRRLEELRMENDTDGLYDYVMLVIR